MDGLPTDPQGRHAGRRDDGKVLLKLLTNNLDQCGFSRARGTRHEEDWWRLVGQEIQDRLQLGRDLVLRSGHLIHLMALYASLQGFYRIEAVSHIHMCRN